MEQPTFKDKALRWVLVNGGNSINVDIAAHVINELGSNGDEVEVMFFSKDSAEEYKEIHCLDDYQPMPIEIKYYTKPEIQIYEEVE